jgi:4-amino-4-deoxy-L-arabinose transferase-like glycosyltransferase
MASGDVGRMGGAVTALEVGSLRVLPKVAFLVAGFMLFARLGGLPLAEPDEGRNSEVAREMMVSGAWLVPTYDGLPYLDKPAFFFRSVALALAAFGENEAAARLPSALSGLVTLVLLFAFCRRRYGEATASLAVIVASTALLLFTFSRLVIMDAMLGTFVCASIFAAYEAEESAGRSRRLWYLASAAAAGCATLVKGPVGFLVPGLVMVAFNLLEARRGDSRRRGALRRLFAPLHVLVFLALVLPWFVSLCLRQPGFLYYGLVEESFNRFTTSSFHRSEPFWFYLPVLFGGLFPWSVLLPAAAIAAWRDRARWTSADRLFAVWTAVVVVFFSLSHSKLAGYVLTAVVALSALTARLLASALEDRAGRAARTLLRGAVAAAVLYGFLGAVLLLAGWRPALIARWPDVYALAGSIPALAAGFVAAAAVLLAARLRRSPELAIAGLALLPAILLTAGYGVLHGIAGGRSSRELAARIGPLPPQTEIACLDCFPESLLFYLRRPVAVIKKDGSPELLRSNYLLFRWHKQGLRSEVLVDPARLDAWIAARRGPIVLLDDGPPRGRLRAVAAPRGLAVTEPLPGWESVLIPAREGR